MHLIPKFFFRILITGTCLFSIELAYSAENILFYLPKAAHQFKFQKEMIKIVEEFNQLNLDTQVKLVWKQGEFSTLKYLEVAQISGIHPHLAIVGDQEVEMVKSPLSKIRLSQKATPQDSLPFARSIPVVLVNEEHPFRYRLPYEWNKLTWKKLVESSTKLREKSRSPAPSYYPIAFATKSRLSLRIAESLFDEPIWTSSSAGIRMAKGSIATWDKLRTDLSQNEISSLNLEINQAIRQFENGGATFLLIMSDYLPYVVEKLKFRWGVHVLPSLNGDSPRYTGNRLVALSADKKVQELVEYLYQPNVAARWASTGGFLFKKKWIESPFGRSFRSAYPLMGSFYAKPHKIRARSGSKNIIKVRDSISKRIAELFGAKATDKSVQKIYSEIEAEIAL